MSVNMSVVKDRTLEDVNRVKQLLSKKYQNMTQAEKDEWDGTMKGRFTYQDMNRVVNNLNIASTIYSFACQGRNQQPQTLPIITPNWQITDTPTSTDFQNIITVLNTLLTETRIYPTITFNKYDYVNFNNLEDNTEKLDNYAIIEDSNGNKTEISLGINNLCVKIENYILTDDNRNSVTFNCPLANLDGAYSKLYNTKVVDLSKVGYFWDETSGITGSIYFTGSTIIERVILNDTAAFILYTNAFKGCTNLKEINLKACKLIGETAFMNCSSLEEVEFSAVLDGQYSHFARCTNLKKVICNSKSISSGCFQYDSNLVDVTLGTNIETIKSYAFSQCTSLQTIKYLGTMAQWNAITKETNWYSYSGLTTIVCTDGTITL